jgi:DNA recombination protein RmuC
MRAKAEGLRTRLAMIEEENQNLKSLPAEIEKLKIEKAKLEGDKKWLEEAEKKLKESFEALSAEVLRSNSSQFMERSKEQLENFIKQLKGDWGTQKQEFKNVVDPLNKELEKLDKQVKEMENKREGAYKSMYDQVRGLSEAFQGLQDTTSKLNQALRSSQIRGRWGELQLKRIAELAGMAEHVDFDEQVSTESGGRPDMTVYLPNGGILPVDSKAPMEAYLDSSEASSPELAKTKLVEHAKSLRGHMKALSQKEYWSQFDNAPQFVAMLVPYESGLGAAFVHDPNLLEDALKNRVVIVSPATLLALLKVVAFGWLQLQLAENAQKIADQGRELYHRFKTFRDHLEDVGSRLNSSMESYNKAVGSMESRVMPSLKKLREMGVGDEDVQDLKQIENQAKVIDSGETD